MGNERRKGRGVGGKKEREGARKGMARGEEGGVRQRSANNEIEEDSGHGDPVGRKREREREIERK